MTSLTPQQIRELADRAQDWSNRAGTKHKPGQNLAEFAAALRTAANQLEAVQEAYEDFAPWCVGFFGRHEKWPDGVEQHLRDLRIALTADATPRA